MTVVWWGGVDLCSVLLWVWVWVEYLVTLDCMELDLVLAERT